MTLNALGDLAAIWELIDQADSLLLVAVMRAQKQPGLTSISDLESLRHQLMRKRDELETEMASAAPSEFS